MNSNIGFSYEIIRDYLVSEGGKVEYHKLIKHFKDALANPENKEARVLFKDLVNQVAVVTTEGNQKFLNLRIKNSADEPPRLPPRSNQNDQLNHQDSRTSLNYHATVNPYYDSQTKLPNQSHVQLAQIAQQLPTSTKYINQQLNLQQPPYQQRPVYSKLDSNLDLSMMNNQLNQTNQLNSHQIKNQFQILDTQPRQPFSYNLSQPVPAFLNQRIHPAELNNLDMTAGLIQPKPIPQVPSLPNLMNANLIRYPNKNEMPSQPGQNLPLPAKNMWSNSNPPNCPPKAPPRRKSFASSSNTYLNRKQQQAATTVNHVKDNENFIHSSPKQFPDKIKEIHELKFNSPGRVKEHAKKLNKMVSESELKPPMPLGNNSANTNIQNNLRDSDSDLNDQVKRRWMVKMSCCDYTELQLMLKDYPKLAEFKDISSGWTALHWAAKFNKPDIVKLIAGTHNANPNVKTSGYTPLLIAAIFDNREIVELLTKGYDADPSIRDHTGKTADDHLRINRQKIRIKYSENGLLRKIDQESKGSSFLARTASLRQTHRQLLDRLPSKYRTNPK